MYRKTQNARLATLSNPVLFFGRDFNHVVRPNLIQVFDSSRSSKPAESESVPRQRKLGPIGSRYQRDSYKYRIDSHNARIIIYYLSSIYIKMQFFAAEIVTP